MAPFPAGPLPALLIYQQALLYYFPNEKAPADLYQSPVQLLASTGLFKNCLAL